jgi:hypothetical protein
MVFMGFAPDFAGWFLFSVLALVALVAAVAAPDIPSAAAATALLRAERRVIAAGTSLLLFDIDSSF